MSEQNLSKPPTWFWAVASFAVLWNLFGVLLYILQVTTNPESYAQLPEAERLLMENTPAWVTGAFAIAVFGGVIGSILLILRYKLATTIFIISMIGILIQMYHSLFMTNSIEVYGPTGWILPVLVIVLGAVFIWVSDMSAKKGWLNS